MFKINELYYSKNFLLSTIKKSIRNPKYLYFVLKNFFKLLQNNASMIVACKNYEQRPK